MAFSSLEELAPAVWPCGGFTIGGSPAVMTSVPAAGSACDVPARFSCGYFNTSASVWMTEGCRAVNATLSQITCACTHLTDFSVLLDSDAQLGGKKKKSKMLPMIAGAVVCGVVLLTVAIIVLAVLWYRSGRLRRHSIGFFDKSNSGVDGGHVDTR